MILNDMNELAGFSGEKQAFLLLANWVGKQRSTPSTLQGSTRLDHLFPTHIPEAVLLFKSIVQRVL